MKKNVKILITAGGIIIALGIGFLAGNLFSNKNNGKDKKGTGSGKDEIVASTEYVELGEYVGVEIDLSVTDEDVKDAIDDLLEEQATYEEKEGIAQNGDTVNINYVGTIDGVEFEGGSGTDDVTIGEGEWIDGFEAGIIGMSTGETRDVACVFPEDFGDEEVNGKAANFSITLNYIQGEEILPTLDEAFVQANSETSTTVEEFLDEMKENLYQENVDYKADFAWDEVLSHTKILSYPENMMSAVAEEIMDGYQGMADMYGQTLDETMVMMGYQSEADFRENDLDDWCKETVADYLVAEAIADLEDIALTDTEYQQALEREYSYYTDTYEDISAFEEAKGEIVRWDELLQKVQEWVGDAAVIMNQKTR